MHTRRHTDSWTYTQCHTGAQSGRRCLDRVVRVGCCGPWHCNVASAKWRCWRGGSSRGGGQEWAGGGGAGWPGSFAHAPLDCLTPRVFLPLFRIPLSPALFEGPLFLGVTDVCMRVAATCYVRYHMFIFKCLQPLRLRPPPLHTLTPGGGYTRIDKVGGERVEHRLPFNTRHKRFKCGI